MAAAALLQRITYFQVPADFENEFYPIMRDVILKPSFDENDFKKVKSMSLFSYEICFYLERLPGLVHRSLDESLCDPSGWMLVEHRVHESDLCGTSSRLGLRGTILEKRFFVGGLEQEVSVTPENAMLMRPDWVFPQEMKICA